MRVALVMGTRPEIIKLAPVVWALESDFPQVERYVVLTGQHGENAHRFCDELRVSVDTDLGRSSDRPAALLGECVAELDRLFGEVVPDVVVVQGDTSSTLAGALAGFYRGIPVAHVEAGLRTGDLARPFPEEGNRRLVGAVTGLHFAPTQHAHEKLMAENIDPRIVALVGNTVVDAVRQVASAAGTAEGRDRLRVVVTMHRRESWGPEYEDLCRGVSDLVASREEADVVFVMHPNPALQARARGVLGDNERIELCLPMGYLDFVSLLSSADLILTDSGGIQEEAVSLGIPLVVLRETTERPEGLTGRAAVLGGVSRESVVLAAERALALGPAADRDLYGDGAAGERIAAMLVAGRVLPERVWWPRTVL